MAKVKRTARRAPAKPNQAVAHRFGAHLSIAGGMQHALAAALEMRFDTVQVFVKNQRQWQAAPLRPDDLARWHELRATPGFGPVMAHATYLINLASADDALFQKSISAFTEELLRCDALGIEGLVVHPGAAGGGAVPQALGRVAQALDQIFRRHPQIRAMPLLEITAGQGSSLGRTFAQLGEIIRRSEHPERLGVCVDTCHVFASGYDIREPVQYEAMIAEAEREVGFARVRCWHFNDSRGELGSRLDRHEHIGLGRIGAAGFRNVLADPRFRGIPMILETPKGTDARGRDWDRRNVARLRAMVSRLK